MANQFGSRHFRNSAIQQNVSGESSHYCFQVKTELNESDVLLNSQDEKPIKV